MTKQQKKSIAMTPVIRAKTSAPAFVSTGHNHDDKYIRYDATHTGLTSSEINQFLVNLNSSTESDAKLVRTDISQSLTSTAKDVARANIGIVDDLGVADTDGDFRTSDFGTKINGNAVSNNDLLEHFIRYDASQTPTSSQRQQFASNADVLSLVSGLSEQTVDSSVKFAGNQFTVATAISKLNAGAIIKGTPLNDTQATVSIAAPNGTETAIIKIVSGALATTVALDCGDNKIINQTDPENAQDGATKNYVDTQILALDLDSSYIRADGENVMGADLDLGGNNAINSAAPTSNSHLTNKAYVDGLSHVETPVTSTAGAGLTTIQSITPSATGVYFVILSGKVTSGTTHTINIMQSATTIASRTLNTDGAGQWSMTIPITLSTLTDVSFTPPSGVAINQFDLVKFGQ